MQQPFYTSRSAVENFQKCPRFRYLNSYHLGSGIVPAAKSIPLTTGTCVHEGIGWMLTCLKEGKVDQNDIEDAVGKAKETYINLCQESGFYGKGVQTREGQEHTFLEQQALTEGLVRAWAKVELNQIEKRFQVLAVEKEIIVKLSDNPLVMFQARVDTELREKDGGDLLNYSLKTQKMWNDRSEKSYRRDLQGITEVWAVEQEQEEKNQKIDEALVLLQGAGFKPEVIQALHKKRKMKRVMGVRFCFLLKGDRKPVNEESESDVWITYSPLIRGYKRHTPSRIELAHSWFYPKPENKTGKGILGKGWEPFNVWEEKGGVKLWIEKLANGEIQPECGDVLKQQVITPVEYIRKPAEIAEAVIEIRCQETKIYHALQGLQEGNSVSEDFPMFRRSCHWPTDCEYIPFCFKREIAEDPIGSGEFVPRIPHHEAERKQLAGKLVRIEKGEGEE